jgi:hypothetical protein
MDTDCINEYTVRNIHGQIGLHGNNARNQRLRSNDRQPFMILLFKVLHIISFD